MADAKLIHDVTVSTVSKLAEYSEQLIDVCEVKFRKNDDVLVQVRKMKELAESCLTAEISSAARKGIAFNFKFM